MKGLFLDRDGVINEDKSYVHKIEDFNFIDGIFDLVRYANQKGFKIIVITNQAGIGRGYYSERQFWNLTKWMKKKFIEHSAPIDKIYFSPFHPTEGIGKYKLDHYSRKPNPGLILRAKKRLNLSLESSFLIGDKLSDIEAGIRANVGTNILFSKISNNNLCSNNKVVRINDLRDVKPLLK